MNYQKDQLTPYLQMDADLIPINIWNKMVKGKQRGKTPVHADWTNREYKQGEAEFNKWADKGYNLGYRIQADQIVVDMDPRNYEGEDCEEKIAELFGYFDFDELSDDRCVVKTGGGGYHIYCLLPMDVDYRFLRETVEELPGVEFKRKGRQVLCAGSKHPSGEYYEWVNSDEQPTYLPTDVLELIKREVVEQNKDYSTGAGALTGNQLHDLILSKLNPEDYDTNDTWFPLLCGAHHATNGDGIEEFVEWSKSDPRYEDCENDIRARWESLWEKDLSITIGTLVRELEQHGEDTSGLKAVLSFASTPDLDDVDEEESDEALMLNSAKRAAADIDVSDVYHETELDDGVDGKALQFVNDLHPTAEDEEVMKALRLIKAASSIEAAKAKDILAKKGILKIGAINKLLKDLDAKIADDLALLLSQKSLETIFNEGKHLTCPPSGMLYAFHKTHWKPISDEFLGKLVQGTLHSLKQKMSIEAQELSLINQAVKLSRIKVSTMTDRIHNTGLPPSVINCHNGELWMNKDGSHVLKPHSYRSYLVSCLNVDYDPSADCPLFKQTLHEIFELFPDTEDMVRHVGEMLGYVIQPYKNMASWWLMRGPGGDGKSTILKILGGILGDSQLMTGVKLLSAGSTDGYSHALNSLVGKLSVVIEELPANYLLKDAGLKLLSENTKMEANPKGKEAFPFMYGGSLIMCSNGFPATRDISHGMFRRANVIPFNRQFDKHKVADIDRAVRILNDPKEMSGVLNFMLEGLQRLRDRGCFQEPESCLVAKEEWFGEANNVVRFLKENVEVTGDSNDIVGDFSNLYGVIYHAWCQDNDIDDKMRKRKSHFKNDLKNLGLSIHIGSGNKMRIYGGKLIEKPIADFEDFDDEDW